MDVICDLTNHHPHYDHDKSGIRHLKEICSSLISFWKFGGGDDEMIKVSTSLKNWWKFVMNEPNICYVFGENCSSSVEYHRLFSLDNDNHHNILSPVKYLRHVIPNILCYRSTHSMRFWTFWLSQISPLDEELKGLTNDNVFQFKNTLTKKFSNWGKWLSDMDLVFLGGGGGGGGGVEEEEKEGEEKKEEEEDIPEAIQNIFNMLKVLQWMKSNNAVDSVIGHICLGVINTIMIDNINLQKFYGKMMNESYALTAHTAMLKYWDKIDWYDFNNWQDLFKKISTYILNIIYCLDKDSPFHDFWSHLTKYFDTSGMTLYQIYCKATNDVEIIHSVILRCVHPGNNTQLKMQIDTNELQNLQDLLNIHT